MSKKKAAATKKATAKKKKPMPRRFDLKLGGNPLKTIITSLNAVIKTGENPAKAIRMVGILQPVVDALMAECGANRWSIDV